MARGSLSKRFDIATNTAHIAATSTSYPSSDTSIIKGRKRALREAYNRSLTAKHSYYCITGSELLKSYKPFIPLLRVQVHQRGGSSLIITNIERETIQAIKDLTEAGASIRHMDFSTLRRCVIYDDRSAYFSIVEEPIITHIAIENVDQTEGEDLWISSTERSVVQSAKRHFLSDWKAAVPAQDRLIQLEKRVEPEFLKVITDTEEAGNLLISIAKSVRKEALSLIPNAKGMFRMEQLGIIDLLIDASRKGAIVKIICPLTETNSTIVKRISEQAPDIKIMNGSEIPSGVLIADNEKFLQAEIKHPMADQFSQAIGFGIYSNSKNYANSFKLFFDLIWNEHVLNEELKKADRMQKEFINIAAHELRTPVQPVISLSEILLTKEGNIEYYRELIDVIIRNGKRLKRLTEDILDVTKIESQSLSLKKERVELGQMILTIVTDYKNQLKKLNNDVKLVVRPKKWKDIFVEADRTKLSRVFENLLDNAIKFTKEGIITVSLCKEEKNKVAVVSIQDSGSGIDLEILPRLFSKFASKSDQGTGLGLYISKGIIEMHGGRILAQNNTGGKGAIMTITLPALLP